MWYEMAVFYTCILKGKIFLEIASELLEKWSCY